ncbi:MAG: 1-deoxy-D-xylulose-5-phosphate synthase [Nitrospinae bacterium]|nr:1-deoxy-D-xylulose-5-phosphate synthase [Nitrospinota bacterium]
MNKFLNSIHSPADLKKIERHDLPELVNEIRKFIINTVSKTGGHIASNLGVVELTIALHYIFNPPEDSIIWDVGHQCYTHKILTGRRDSFATLRQYKGISGFPRRDESIYDAFDTGHSGTSISLALAFAIARDKKHPGNSVMAVIGDGSMTAGLALEGLNNAGVLNSNLIVVLNDNKMSISPNVGAISAILNKIITGQMYNKMKGEVESLIKNIPGIGGQMAKLAHRVEDAIKGIFVPGRFFEDLGFKYVGPIDGHNLNHLLDTFESVKRLRGPILVHVVTTKGKGYKPAEDGANSFHGASPFDVTTGNFKKKKAPLTYTEIFSKTLVSLAKTDERIVAITAAMSDGTGLDSFAVQFKKRFYDVGIAEQHAVTFAAGLASQGFKPVVAIYSTFLQRAYDQILHDVCLTNLPVTFAVDRAGIVGEDGPTHQGLFDLSYLRSMPNMVLMAPKDENELQHMIKTAIEYNGPAAVRYPRGSGEGVKLTENIISIDIGRGEVMRNGYDIAILAIGSTVYPSLEAASILFNNGIDAFVVNMRFVKPIDRKIIIESCQKTGALITVEENVLQGGFGSAVLEVLEEEGMNTIHMKRIGIPDRFIEHGSQSIIREKYQLTPSGIATTILEFLKKSGIINSFMLRKNAKKAVG